MAARHGLILRQAQHEANSCRAPYPDRGMAARVSPSPGSASSLPAPSAPLTSAACAGACGACGACGAAGGGGKGDMAVRLLVVNMLAYPAPQLGLSLYLLLEARSLSEQPVLAWVCCEKPTPVSMRALAQDAWQRTHLRTGQPALAV